MCNQQGSLLIRQLKETFNDYPKASIDLWVALR